MKKLLLVVMLSGCAGPQYTQIDYSRKPPEGWPTLRQQITYGSEEQVKRWCARAPGAAMAGDKLKGCALAYFEWNLCTIFLTSKDPEQLKHEQAHCAGYNHVGEPNLSQQAYDAWKAKQK